MIALISNPYPGIPSPLGKVHMIGENVFGRCRNLLLRKAGYFWI